MSAQLPGITSRQPGFGNWAPIATGILWSATAVGWIFFFRSTPAHPSSPPDTKDYIAVVGFIGMVFGTVVLFVAGILVLVAAVIIYHIRFRRYQLEQANFVANQPTPPPPR
ncbi:hypothetical protein [Granulicella sp. L60]|uniref:hypothetical protein n=1 Tax=Granulicella sp. L60 TaxID=1641866 RepID=UPI00131CCA33|nr:hypothetical protein [Granulicella sp. L60]